MNKEDCLDFPICSVNFHRMDEQSKGPPDLGCEDCHHYKPQEHPDEDDYPQHEDRGRLYDQILEREP